MLHTEARALATDQLPNSIGPYQLGERLGAGGMGEVYRAYDARLDRAVALKRVRPGVGDPDLALRRFRREARAAARLRHSAIVQVHDWVETEEGAWLVMELVEGRSLRALLSGGPLAPGRVAGFARDLLEGLTAAHDAGLVHRDLKASNVMVSDTSSAGRGRGERAQILDFGLAKKAHIDEESQLSVDGKLIGTLSAMAPEQVLGHPVDARTDLFALGCLLYEALTGCRPFLGSSAGETLYRICNVYQPGVRALRPEVPASLSDFVDRLMQKDPRRRPSSAAAARDQLEEFADAGETFETLETGIETEASWRTSVLLADGDGDTGSSDCPASRRSLGTASVVAVTFAAVVVASVFFWRRSVEPVAAPIYVAVPATIGTTTGERPVELGARAIHTALLQGLIDLQGIVALEVPADAADGTIDLARELAADEVLFSGLECDELVCSASLRRVNNDGRVLSAWTFTVEPDRLKSLREAALGHLAAAYPAAQRRPGAAEFAVRSPDYEKFLRLHERFQTRNRGLSSGQLLEELESLSRTSPKFVAAPLLIAHVALQRFQGSRSPDDAQRANAAIDRALALAPQDPRVLMLAARAARQAGDLDAAEEWLAKVKLLEPGHPGADFQLALLSEQRGDVSRAVALLQEIVSRHPSAYHLFNGADLLYRHGDFTGARRLIEKGLERAPNRFDGLSRLAQLELAHGNLERAALLYRQLVDRSPEETELTNLGTALMMLGRFTEARDCFARVVEQNPSSPYATLSLADVADLQGEAEEAAAFYKRVLELTAADASAASLASVRAQALAHLGEKEAAVEAIQAAIQQRPDHPWVAYEAALVHTLIDDRVSAMWNARRALDAGIEPRWFSLTWFEPIRADLREAFRRRSNDGERG